MRVRWFVLLLVFAAFLHTPLLSAVEPQAGEGTLSMAARRHNVEALRLRSRRGLPNRRAAPGKPDSTPLSTLARPSAIASNAPTVFGQQWQPLGPAQVSTSVFGTVTGRVNTIAVDPADGTGNTVYVGTLGGGVWKSTNAAGAPGAVAFTPLTDNLPAFSSGAAASISIGALSVQPGGTGVVLAGTGDPNNSPDSYYGSGLLRSADGGLTWDLIQSSEDAAVNTITDYYFTGLAFAGFAWSSVNPSLVLAAMTQSSEAVFVGADEQENQAGRQASVMGLYYSTDAGQSWLLATITDGPNQVIQTSDIPVGGGGNAVTAITWNPLRQRFYAAVRFHGYYESMDGMTFTRLANQPGPALTRTMCPTHPNSVGSPGCPILRGALATQPASGDLFALTIDLNLQDQGLWQDVCTSASAACASPIVTFSHHLPSTAIDDSSGSLPLGDYDLWLAATPLAGDTLLFVGTTDIYRCSLAAGCLFRNTTNTDTCAAARVAPFQHAADLTFAESLSLEYFGNDSGLWRTTDNVGQSQPVCNNDDAVHFQNLNGGLGSLAEVHALAQDPTQAGVLLAGLGVNGTVAGAVEGQAVWPQVLDGFGSFVSIDQVNPQNWYAQSSAGVAIYRCTDGTACAGPGFGSLAVGYGQLGNEAYASPDPTPFLLDPQDSNILLLGTCHVWRGAADGSDWSSADLLGPLYPAEGPDCVADGFIQALGASGPAPSQPIGTETLYAGMAGLGFGGPDAYAGHLFQAVISAATPVPAGWTDLSNSPVTNSLHGFNPQDFSISGIAIDAHDPSGQTLYVTVQGFSTAFASTPNIYRSTNGGASWRNITSNLPPNPANSVAIDPDDPNTVYVALDMGVYVTTAVTTCGLQNCWSVYGAGLPNAPVTQLLTFKSGGRSLLRAGTYGRGIWQIPLVSAGTPQTMASALPAALAFLPQAVQSQSSPQAVTLTNTGSLPMIVSTIAAVGDFAAVSQCGAAVVPGGTCLVQVTYLPSASGPSAGTLTIDVNVAGGSVTVPLTGIGLFAGSVQLLPSTIDFGLSVIGVPAVQAQNVTISNNGSTAITLQSPSVSGDFLIVANTCTTSLAAGSGCTVSIGFTPTDSGARSGLFSISDSAGTQSAALSGTGVSPATNVLSASSLSFGAQPVGSVSPQQALTLTNSGDQPLNLIEVTAIGDFQAVNGCGHSLIGHSSCSIQVTFVPTHTGPDGGSLTISDILGRPQAVSLLGSGASPATDTIAPVTLSFPAQATGTISTSLPVTLSNSGDAPLNLISGATTGDFRVTNGCGSLLAGHATCSFLVTYAPTAAGPETGTLTVKDMFGKPLTVGLSGTGLAAATDTVTPLALLFSDQVAGTSSLTQAVTLSNVGDVPLTSISVSVQGDFQANNGCLASLAAHSTCTISVSFAPTQFAAETGTLTIGDVLGHLQVVKLSGSGVHEATDSVSPGSLSFGPLVVGTTSQSQTITLTNTGTATLKSITVAISGDFHLSSDCNKTLAAQASCTMRVTYVPAIAAYATGLVSVAALDASTKTVTLQGTGIVPATISAAPATLDFSIWGVNGTSPTQSVTFTNTGGLALQGLVLSSTVDYALSQSSCMTTLAPGASCAVQVAFVPTRGGPRPGSITLASPSLDKAFKLDLSGSGLGFNLKINGDSTATITSGQTATYQLQLVPSAGSIGPVSLSCAGGPATDTCVVTPSSVQLTAAGQAAATVTISTIAAAGASGPSKGPGFAAMLLPAAGFLLFAFPNRRRRGCVLAFALLAGIGAGILGCGVTSSSGSSLLTKPGSTPGSPLSITYNPVVTATGPGVSQSLQLTLTVQ